MLPAGMPCCALMRIIKNRPAAGRFCFYAPQKGETDMAQIKIQDLSFYYEGSFAHIFEHVSLSLDTDWKLGLIGRNGKGKTTFLELLRGTYAYQGTISAPVKFAYFPYTVTEAQMQQPAVSFMQTLKPDCEEWRVICELQRLGETADVLYQPFRTLSAGQQTKLLLAVLFSGGQDFLLIDEPTNHLDQVSRMQVRQYLAEKQGFILVSHDRDLLDACVDHVLVLNRKTIELQSGNFSSWQENKARKDQFAEAENEKHRKEIRKLRKAAKRTADWAEKSERTKIGFDPVKEHDRCISTRAFIGSKTKKMQSRVRQIEGRISREIEEQEGLLQDLEHPAALQMTPLTHHKQTLLTLRDYSLQYDGAAAPLFRGLNLTVQRGDRIALHGGNGAGKTTLFRMLLHKAGLDADVSGLTESGSCELASGLIISYVPQSAAGLQGTLPDFCAQQHLDRSMFCTVLRQLDLDRAQFEKPFADYSEGQKKKVLLAASLLTPAHLYIWDEPLNYIDVFSRMQIETLLTAYQPTLLFAEHDVRFRSQIGAATVGLTAP